MRFAKTRFCAALLLSAAALPAQTPDFYDPDAYRTIYLTFASPTFFSQLQANYVSEVEIPADMVVDGVTYPQVGVRIRGNTSYTQLPAGSQKVGLNIKLDSFVPGQEIMGYDHLNLNNGFHDPTFLREFLSYYVMRQYGPAPRCNFVKLYLNGTYWGVYVNVQQPNKDFTKQWWRTGDGNRYRCFPTSGGFNSGQCAFTWLGSNVASYLASYQAKQGDGVDLMNFCNVLNNTPTATLQAALHPVFSVDSFYRYAAVMNALTNTDSYLGSGKDHYLYHDDYYGQFHVFPFDLNEALAGSTTLSHLYNTTLSTRPAFTKTFQYPELVQRYVAHFRTIAEDTIDWNVLGPIATTYHNMINADVAADTKKIYTYAQFLTNLTAPVTVAGGGPGPGGGSTTIPGLQPLVNGRRAYLLGLADFTAVRATLSGLTRSPQDPTPSDAVTFTATKDATAASVNLWYRATGPFVSTPMFDDGLHGDGAAGDNVFGATLPAFAAGSIVEYYAQAVTAAGRQSYFPKTAEHLAPSFVVGWPQGPSPVRINEFMAQNTATIQDPQGEYEDYVELYNPSSAPAAVGGMYLTDNLTNVTKWQIPAGTSIPAGGTLLVWADEDGVDGPTHANFKLSANGEALGLFEANGTQVADWLYFGPQVANVSSGRLVDGAGPAVTFLDPTPGAANAPVCGVRRFSALNSTAHTMSLAVSGVAAVNSGFSFEIAGGPASTQAFFALSTLPAYLPVAGTAAAILLEPAFLAVAPVDLNAVGAFSLPVVLPNDPALAGLVAYAQAAAVDAAAAFFASNAVEVVVCP